MSLNIYNSSSKQVEEFSPINQDEVLMYTCGPTAYDFAHIGNFRTFFTSDIILRTLRFNDYNVKFVMNLTDLGHLTDDGDDGDDKMEVAAEREGKSARDVADFYIKAFKKDFEALNMHRPAIFTRATDYIAEQIEMIQDLENKGYIYKTVDGVYFDTSKYDDYGKQFGLDIENVQEGARVRPNPDKKNQADFALWKFSPVDQQRWQEYDSPWGKGYPGWHIECSAMVRKELGITIDIHLGGEDHRMPHHPNEIAQSVCANEKPLSKYWVHVTHLQVDGGGMAKSQGTGYTLEDVVNRGYTPMDIRFFYMTAHYRSPLNFTWESLQSAHNSLKKLYDLVSGYKESEYAEVNDELIQKFTLAVNSDFNMPKAIAVVWELLKSEVEEPVKIKTLLKMDEVLGLNLGDHVGYEIPQKVKDIAKMRWDYKQSGIWDKADQLRKEASELGYLVEDTKEGYKVRRKL
ncbi:cysteine--tRNA ligase [Patescibacteria group bacterium]